MVLMLLKEVVMLLIALNALAPTLTAKGPNSKCKKKEMNVT